MIRATCTRKVITKLISEETMEHQAVKGYNMQYYDLALQDARGAKA